MFQCRIPAGRSYRRCFQALADTFQQDRGYRRWSGRWRWEVGGEGHRLQTLVHRIIEGTALVTHPRTWPSLHPFTPESNRGQLYSRSGSLMRAKVRSSRRGRLYSSYFRGRRRTARERRARKRASRESPCKSLKCMEAERLGMTKMRLFIPMLIFDLRMEGPGIPLSIPCISPVYPLSIPCI